MPANEIHVGDIGTIFEVELLNSKGQIVPLDQASVMQIIFVKKDKTKVTNNAILTTNGLDGKMQYVSIVGDLDQKGLWKIQGKVTTPSGSWSTDIDSFEVFENL